MHSERRGREGGREGYHSLGREIAGQDDVHAAAGRDDFGRADALVELADRVGEGTGGVDDALEVIVRGGGFGTEGQGRERARPTFVRTTKLSPPPRLVGSRSLIWTPTILAVSGSLSSWVASAWLTTVAPYRAAVRAMATFMRESLCEPSKGKTSQPPPHPYCLVLPHFFLLGCFHQRPIP